MRQPITWILWKGDRRDYPNRLIRCLVRNTGAYAWGAAVTLVNFKDSTVLIDELNAAMRRRRPGSMVAHAVVKAGKPTVLPEALQFSETFVNRVNEPFTELQSAAQLFLDTGAPTSGPSDIATWRPAQSK